MRRIVLSKEERERYERLAKDMQRKELYKRTKRNKPRAIKVNCQGCLKLISLKSSAINGHPEYCSKSCMQFPMRKKKKGLRHEERFLTAEQKRARRQKRRNERLSASSQDFYTSREWRDLRFRVLRHHGFCCMACGRSRKMHGVVMHVDHIKPRSKFPELELDQDNLQVMCEDCNLGKSNGSTDDLRPE